MGWPQCPEQNHLGEQAVCPKPGRFSGAYPSQDREFRAASVHPSDSGGSADPGTRPSSRQSISVPLSPDRRHVPPGHRGESPQKDPERHRIGASQILRSPAHLRHHRPVKRRGRENCLLHAWALRRCLYSAHLYPRSKAKAGRSRPDHGKPHGPGHISQKGKQGRKHKLPALYSLNLSGLFGAWVTVWVNGLIHILIHTKKSKFATKNPQS